MSFISNFAQRKNCAYIRDDFARVNLLADKVTKYPLIVETLPTDGTINASMAPALQVSKNVIVCFLTPCNLDFTGDEATVAINDMLRLACEFVNEYVDINPDMVRTVNFNAVLDFLDANLAGVRLTLPLVDDYNCY